VNFFRLITVSFLSSRPFMFRMNQSVSMASIENLFNSLPNDIPKKVNVKAVCVWKSRNKSLRTSKGRRARTVFSVTLQDAEENGTNRKKYALSDLTVKKSSRC
jgi:hypothetical protein